MKLYRFSPIENKEQLIEAIKYTHFACFKLCKKALGKHLPVAGNMGIFCHYDREYKFLTKLREELAEKSDNWNQKYYRLREPVIIPAKDNIPETSYTYLYIRKPDAHKEVGDVDFVLDEKSYFILKNSLLHGEKMRGIKILDRPNLDLIEIFDQDFDVLSFIGTKDMAENVKVNTN